MISVAGKGLGACSLQSQLLTLQITRTALFEALDLFQDHLGLSKLRSWW